VTTRTVHELWDRQDAREALSLPVSLEDRILIALRLSRYAGCADHWQVRFCAAAALTRAAEAGAVSYFALKVVQKIFILSACGKSI
jgi:hypothetical protein